MVAQKAGVQHQTMPWACNICGRVAMAKAGGCVWVLRPGGSVDHSSADQAYANRHAGDKNSMRSTFNGNHCQAKGE